MRKRYLMSSRIKIFFTPNISIIALGLLIGISILVGNLRFLDIDSWQITNQHQPPLIKQGHFFLNSTVRSVFFRPKVLPDSNYTISLRVKPVDGAPFKIKLVQDTTDCSAVLTEDSQNSGVGDWHKIVAENKSGKMKLSLNGKEVSTALFNTTTPVSIWIEKETNPVFMDDFVIRDLAGNLIFKDDFGKNVFGIFRSPFCILAGVLIALLIFRAEGFVRQRVSFNRDKENLISGFFAGWTTLIIFSLIFGVLVTGVGILLWLTIALGARFIFLYEIGFSTKPWGKIWPALGLLAAAAIGYGYLFYIAAIHLGVAKKGGLFFLFGSTTALFTFFAFCAFLGSLLFIAAVLLIKGENHDALLNLARAAALPIIAAPALLLCFKSASGWSLFFIDPQTKGFFATVTLALTTYFVFHFVVTNRKKLPFSGLVSVVLIITLFSVGELGVRLSPINTRLKPLATGKAFTDNEELFFVPEGFFTTVDGDTPGAPFILEQPNFRSGSPALPKPEGLFRIMVMGGSNVWGDGVEDPDLIFSGILEKNLNLSHPDMNIEVINAGMQGYVVFQLLLMLKLFAIDYSPDMIILYVNRNDSTTQFGPYTLRELWKMRGNLPTLESVTEPLEQTPESGHRIRRLLRKSRAYNGMVLLIVGTREQSLSKVTRKLKITKQVNPLEDYVTNLEEFYAICKQNMITLVLADEYIYWANDPGPDSSFIKTKTAMTQTAKRLNLPYLPVHKMIWEKYPDGQLVFPTDIVHLNYEGHKFVAELMSDFLIKEKLLNKP